MPTRQDVQSVFCESLNLDPSEVNWASLEYRSIPEWDSVAHMALVSSLEGSFSIMLDVDDVIGLSSFDIALEILVRHGVTITDQ